MGEIAVISEVDGRQIGNGAMGPVTENISALFQKLTETEGISIF